MDVLSDQEIERLKSAYYEPQQRGFKTLCRSCSGNSFWITPDNGLCHCFKCAYNARMGSVDFTHQAFEPSPHIDEIRELYTELTAYYHSNLRKEDREELYERGLNDDTIDQFKIGYVPPYFHNRYKDPLAYEGGIAFRDKGGDYVPFLADRIVFPYIVDGVTTEMRGRSSSADIKYLSLFRSPREVGATFPFNDKDRIEAHTYVITEGEIKALAAHQAGVRCVALPGMASWREAILPDANTRVIILFDRERDPLKQLQTNKAIERAASKVHNSYVAMLPLLDQNKMDIDAFLIHKNGGVNAFHELIEGALPFDWWRMLQRRV